MEHCILTTVLNTFYMYLPIILIVIMSCTYYYPPFIDEKMEAQSGYVICYTSLG